MLVKVIEILAQPEEVDDSVLCVPVFPKESHRTMPGLTHTCTQRVDKFGGFRVKLVGLGFGVLGF